MSPRSSSLQTSRRCIAVLVTGLVAFSGCTDRLFGPGERPSFSAVATTPNLKVAFIGDQGNGESARRVLQLILAEGADMVLHSGDFDYHDDPAAWDDMITSVLGADFPYFASVGNHDTIKFRGLGGYQEKLAQRLARVAGATCTGDLGVNSTCRNQGLFFVLSGIGTLGTDHAAYLQQELAVDNSIWRICSWHRNQKAMQVGGKSDDVGWLAYETCRQQGAIIATAHEHSYHRTRTLVSTELQTVDPEWPAAGALRVAPGATFVFVSGLGGNSIRDQERCLPTTFPYGCKGEWASIYTSNQGARYGALFIEFNVDGDPTVARGYFKNIEGTIVDQFTISAQPAEPPLNQAPAAAFTQSCTGLSCTFTDQSTDGDGTVVAWSWDFGDGTTSTSQHPTRTYAAAGTYTVTLTVTDDDGAPNTTSNAVTVTAPPPNQAPTAAFTPNCTDLTCNFTDQSTDSDGTLVAWSWTFGDGATSTAQNPSHTYTAGGTYTVTLTVTDNDGAPNTTSNQVTVTAPPVIKPVVSACNPASGSRDAQLVVQVTGSNFQSGATAGFGERIVVQKVTFVSGSRLDVRIRVHGRALPGARTVTVTNPNGQSGSLAGCFTVN